MQILAASLLKLVKAQQEIQTIKSNLYDKKKDHDAAKQNLNDAARISKLPSLRQ